jgi:DNA-binding transcriptional LysR family regulator
VETRQIQYFLAVVEHGGFSRAASALDVSQPTLSQSVKSLERELGADLFHRAAHGVVLSAAGQALVGPARQLMRGVRAARTSVGVRRGDAVVELIASPPLGVEPGAALVGSFLSTHPGVEVRVERHDIDDEVPAMVRDGTGELGLAYLPASRLGLVEIGLGEHELRLTFPPESEPGPDPLPLATLGGTPVVGIPRGAAGRDLVEAALRAAGARTRLVMELSQRDMVVELVLAGVGAAFMPITAADEARARGAVVRSTDPPIRRGYGLVHRPAPLSTAAAAFVAHARRGC